MEGEKEGEKRKNTGEKEEINKFVFFGFFSPFTYLWSVVNCTDNTLGRQKTSEMQGTWSGHTHGEEVAYPQSTYWPRLLLQGEAIIYIY